MVLPHSTCTGCLSNDTLREVLLRQVSLHTGFGWRPSSSPSSPPSWSRTANLILASLQQIISNPEPLASMLGWWPSSSLVSPTRSTLCSPPPWSVIFNLIVQSLPTKLNNQTRASGHIDRTTVITPFQQAGSSGEGSVNKTSQPLGRDQQEKLAEVMSLTKQKKNKCSPLSSEGKAY
jgi:hypothetical protein